MYLYLDHLYLDYKEISQFIHLHIYTYILSEMCTILALHKTHKNSIYYQM